jgi:hypothetical protein
VRTWLKSFSASRFTPFCHPRGNNTFAAGLFGGQTWFAVN